MTRPEKHAPETNDSSSFKDSVTTGAAAGYVNDRACAACHIEVYNSYQQMGMAKSFFRPAADKVIEDFNKDFYAEESLSTIHSKAVPDAATSDCTSCHI